LADFTDFVNVVIFLCFAQKSRFSGSGFFVRLPHYAYANHGAQLQNP